MTVVILCSIVLGILAGRFGTEHITAFQWIVDNSGWLTDIGLYALLFFVGLGMGRSDTVVSDIKKAGWRVILFPFATMIGTLMGAAVISVGFSYSAKECMAIAAGFGWYSLAPALLVDYSATISAISFLANIMREFLSLLLIPVVAKRVGYVESTSLPGAAALGACFGVTIRATNERIVIFSVTGGMMLAMLVPILVPMFLR